MAAVKFIRESTSGELAFYTSASATSGVERMRIDNAGNVGIGDTSPQGKLEVNNRNTATGAALFIKGGTDSLSPIAGQYTGLAFGYGGGDIYNNASILWEFTNTAANGKLHFAVNPTAGDGTANLSDSKMTIQDNGNVGIGTTSPLQKLDVRGSTYISGYIVGFDTNPQGNYAYRLTHDGGNSFLNVQGGNVGIGVTGPVNKIQANYAPVGIASLTASAGTSSTNWNRNAFLMGTGALVSNALAFGVSGTANDRKAWIQSGHPDSAANSLGTISLNPLGGNVGIGTTSPSTQLDVYHSTAPRMSLSFAGGAGNGGAIDFNLINGSVSQPITLQIKGIDDGAYRQHMTFSTKLAATGASALEERMRITSGGILQIGGTNASPWNITSGTVSQVSLNDPSYPLVVAKTSNILAIFNRVGTTGTMIEFKYQSNVNGSISTNGTNVTFNTSSDYRLKEDLQDFNGLDMVSKIPVYDFKWKVDENRSYGVMAHELQEVLPDAVSGEKDAEEMQGVDYSKIVPLLVKAIQELKAEIEILKNK